MLEFMPAFTLQAVTLLVGFYACNSSSLPMLEH